jgi:glutathione S-transferase
MIELFQAEWCPSSHRVRERMTELGIDYVNRQVPAEREARATLRAALGEDSIPALRLENGAGIVGDHNILAYLGEHFDEPADAEAHREKAENMRLSRDAVARG